MDSHLGGEFWSAFSHDPRDARLATMRASDQDRAVVQQALTEAYADGRLDRDELDERTEQASRSRTLGELPPLVSDLIASTSSSLVGTSRAELARRAELAWQTRRREAVFGFLGASTITTAIWFATCWGSDGFEPYFFWPAFVIIVSLLNLLRTLASRRDYIEGQVRRLEKKRAKELGAPPAPEDRASE